MREQAGHESTLAELSVIDLRDPNVADGLAEALTRVSALGERAGAAEARAEIARHDRMAAAGQVRRLTSDLECEQAERHRLEIDNAELSRENRLRLEQLERAQADTERTRVQLRRAVATADRAVARLRNELAASQRSVNVLETLVGRRKRRSFQAIITTDRAIEEPSPDR